MAVHASELNIKMDSLPWGLGASFWRLHCHVKLWLNKYVCPLFFPLIKKKKESASMAGGIAWHNAWNFVVCFRCKKSIMSKALNRRCEKWKKYEIWNYKKKTQAM
jgi:hypothetical protein